MPRTFHSSSRTIKPLFGEPIPPQDPQAPSHWVEAAAKTDEDAPAAAPVELKAKRPVRTRAKKKLIPESAKPKAKAAAHHKSEETHVQPEVGTPKPQEHQDPPTPAKAPDTVADQTSRLLHHAPTAALPAKDPNPQFNLHSTKDDVQWVKLPNQALHRVPDEEPKIAQPTEAPLEIRHSFADEDHPEALENTQDVSAPDPEVNPVASAPKIRLRLEYHDPHQEPKQPEPKQPEEPKPELKTEEPKAEEPKPEAAAEQKPTPIEEKTDQPKLEVVPARPNSQLTSSIKKSVLKWLLITLVVGLVLAGGVVGWKYLSASFPGPDTTAPVSMVNLTGKITALDGQVERQTTGGWEKVSIDQTIKAGEVIRAGDKSKAIITLGDGSFVRLDQDSSVAFNTLTSQAIKLEQRTGRSYHNVHSGTNYQVAMLDAVVTAHGTSFSTKIIADQNYAEVAVSKDRVSVAETYIATPVTVIASSMAQIDFLKHQISVVAITTDQAADSFWQWNLQLDANPQGAIVPTATPTPSVEPTATPEPSPTPTPVPTLDTTVSALFLTAVAQSHAVRFNWKITGVAPTGFKLAMSLNPNPTYPPGPDDVVVDIPSPDARSYTWTNLDNTPRHFRLGVYNGHGGTRWYSNDVTATALP